MTASSSGTERRARILEALRAAQLDAVVCVLPSDVLLLSGYWPVVATSVAIASASGEVVTLVPQDEAELAEHGWARTETYEPGSLKVLTSPESMVATPLKQVLENLGLTRGRLGMEQRTIYEESSYSATYRMQTVIKPLLSEVVPEAVLEPADAVLAELRSRLTDDEVRRVEQACTMAESAYELGRRSIAIDALEPDVATAVSAGCERDGLADPAAQRAGAFVWCMSGPNSAEAGGAFARTRNRRFRSGDLVLVHSNPYIDGYFTDITRTYCIGRPNDKVCSMYEAIFEAREAAWAAIDAGVEARQVDAAARTVLDRWGFGQYFTHGVGHNVGFTAISPDFPPRLHPASPDVLQIGSTFNLEPAIYIPGFGGIRHCDVVTVTKQGPRLLTAFHNGLESLVLPV